MAVVHPGNFFRDLMPQYARAAQIVGLVYDNISRIYKPEHSAGENAAEIITAWGDTDIIQARCLLGFYKPTIGGTPEEIRQAVINFNELLEDNHITPHDFTGSELSDAEHFYASAVLTMVPILGLVASPAGSLLWDLYLPEAKAIVKNYPQYWRDADEEKYMENFARGIRYDVDQLLGPDLAGHRYGLVITYYENLKYAYRKIYTRIFD